MDKKDDVCSLKQLRNQLTSMSVGLKQEILKLGNEARNLEKLSFDQVISLLERLNTQTDSEVPKVRVNKLFSKILSESHVKNQLEEATKNGNKSFIEECEKFIIKHIDEGNFLSIVDIAHSLKNLNLMRACIEYAYSRQESLDLAVLNALRNTICALGCTEWDIVDHYKQIPKTLLDNPFFEKDFIRLRNVDLDDLVFKFIGRKISHGINQK